MSAILHVVVVLSQTRSHQAFSHCGLKAESFGSIFHQNEEVSLITATRHRRWDCNLESIKSFLLWRRKSPNFDTYSCPPRQLPSKQHEKKEQVCPTQASQRLGGVSKQSHPLLPENKTVRPNKSKFILFWHSSLPVLTLQGLWRVLEDYRPSWCHCGTNAPWCWSL